MMLLVGVDQLVGGNARVVSHLLLLGLDQDRGGGGGG